MIDHQQAASTLLHTLQTTSSMSMIKTARTSMAVGISVLSGRDCRMVYERLVDDPPVVRIPFFCLVQGRTVMTTSMSMIKTARTKAWQSVLVSFLDETAEWYTNDWWMIQQQSLAFHSAVSSKATVMRLFFLEPCTGGSNNLELLGRCREFLSFQVLTTHILVILYQIQCMGLIQ